MADKTRTTRELTQDDAGPTRLFWGERARAVRLPRGKRPYLLRARSWPHETATLIQRVDLKWKTGAKALARQLSGEGQGFLEPWETPALVQAIEGLEHASPDEAVSFVGDFGFLGYPDQNILNGEPLGWMRWQGQRMRYIRGLLEAARREEVEPIRRLMAEGTLGSDAIWLPRIFLDAIRLYVITSDGMKPPDTKSPREPLKAARYALRDEAQELLRRSRLSVVTTRWHISGILPKAHLRLQWDASLIDTVKLGMLWAVYFGKDVPAIRICPICASPYVTTHGRKDCGSLRCGYSREKRQQRILRALGMSKGEVRWGLVRRLWELLNEQERELIVREAGRLS